MQRTTENAATITANATNAASGSRRLLLTLGDGDLSFSAALARCSPDNLLVATTFDSRDALLRKYGDAAAKVGHPLPPLPPPPLCCT